MTFPILARFDTTTEYAEIGQGGRIEVYGVGGLLPVSMTGPGNYYFNQLSVDHIKIQNLKLSQDGIIKSSAAAMVEHATRESFPSTSEQLIIVALVHQLGGAVTVT